MTLLAYYRLARLRLHRRLVRNYRKRRCAIPVDRAPMPDERSSIDQFKRMAR